MQHTSTTTRRGDAVWVTLARGDRNLLDAELTEWLLETVRSLDAEAPTAIVLTGAGDTFCGGADGPHLRQSGTAQQFADACVALFELMHSMSTPVIAALNGDALAGGFGLTCLADIVVAVEQARLGTIEASLGTWAMIAQAPVLARMPAKSAVTNLLTGIPFTAEHAVALGVVDEVVRADELEPAVDRYVDLLTPGAAAARIGRPLMRNVLDPAFSNNLRTGAKAFVQMFG